MGSWKEKIKESFKNNGVDQKRKTENLVVFLIILIITVICINVIWKEDKTEDSIPKDNNVKLAQTTSHIEEGEDITINESNLEKRLEEILKKMNGVEDVKVLITYSETNQVVPMYNEKQKETITTDSQEGQKTETDTTKEVVFEESGSTKTPVLQTTKLPKMEGAVITAKGAENIEVKANIIQAVEAATRIKF